MEPRTEYEDPSIQLENSLKMEVSGDLLPKVIDAQSPKSDDSKLHKAVLDALECPVCSNYASQPILQCVEGHTICFKCRVKVTICPICRGELISTRVKGLEALAELVEYPCPYSNCKDMLEFSQLGEHSLTCEHREFGCIFDPKCSWLGKKKQLQFHGFDSHTRNIYLASSVTFHLDLSKKLCYMYVFVMAIQQNMFQVIFSYDAVCGRLYGVIKQLCKYTDSKEFIAKICFQSNCNERPRPSLTVANRPIPEREASTSIELSLSNTSLRLCIQSLKNLLNGAHCTVKVSIRRSCPKLLEAYPTEALEQLA